MSIHRRRVDGGGASCCKGGVAHDQEDLLIDASTRGDEGRVLGALQRGARVHARDDTPLIAAATGGHASIVKILLENGAQVDARNNTPLIQAVTFNKPAVVEMLIRYGGKEMYDHDNYRIAMNIAQARNYPHVYRLLLDNSNKRNRENMSSIQKRLASEFLLPQQKTLPRRRTAVAAAQPSRSRKYNKVAPQVATTGGPSSTRRRATTTASSSPTTTHGP